MSLLPKQKTTSKKQTNNSTGKCAGFIGRIKRDELKPVKVEVGMASSTWGYELHQTGSEAGNRQTQGQARQMRLDPLLGYRMR